ncbi:MAG TPA: sigma-54 dependent transcriptional regulator [Candidatus Didemnitutus sp.]|jgi:NtrC-family two-component system response regulator AlgB
MRVLVVDDQRSIRLSTSQSIRAEGHEADTAESGNLAALKLQEERYDLVLLDLFLEGGNDGLECLSRLLKITPHLPVVICTAHGSIETAVEAMRRGAQDYLEKPFTSEHLRQILARTERARRLSQRVDELEQQVAQTGPAASFLGDDPEMESAVSIVARAANTRATILLLGENGTGKSSLARHIHRLSPFAAGPFVTVSCPSLSRELLESELFGHAKGAFTGAIRDTWGKVDAARGGTLFLDEIGELPSELQPKLLRLLQERAYERVGDTKTRLADVRVVAATSRDLAAAVKTAHFREDLFYRLNVISVVVPPLCNRPVGLQRHAREFLTFFAAEAGRPVREFAGDAWQAIRNYRWPGNLRELRNAIERAVILSTSGELCLSDLPEGIASAGHPGLDVALGALVPLKAIEESHVRQVTARTATLEEAARILGVDVATIYRKRKRWASRPPVATEVT